ncbi:hypothetical protein ABKV19_014623 [Rosa sericea]
MARGKKIARPRSDASGLEDSSTATSPSFPALLEAAREPEGADPTLEQAASQPAASQPSGSEAAASVGEAPSEKSGIKRSFVWEHFKEYDKIEHAKDADGKDIQIVHKRAHCMYCPRGKVGDFAVESSKNGTSGMIRHINLTCRYYPPNMEKSQKNLVGDKFKGNRLTAVTYNQDDYLEACVEMIVIDELPFSFVEKKGFNRFCVKVCPLFDVPSRRKLCRTFLSMYDTSKKDLKKTLRKYRLSLTTDTWTSVQNVNRLDIFKKTVEREKLPCKGLVCLDVPTRWNSTYLMLEAALKFKKAFTVMAEDEDSNFANYFKEPDEEYDEDGNLVPSRNNRNRVGPPEVGDWEKAEVFVEFLRVFYDVTLRVSASLHPTVHTTFHDVITMEKNIDNMFLEPEIATGSETEKVLMDMAANMRSRWFKYYGSFHEINHMIIIGLVLDARFKLKNVTHIFQTEGLNNDEVQRRTLEIKTLLFALYDQYVLVVDGGRHLQRQPSPGSSSSTLTSRSSRGGVRGQLLNNWKKVVEESSEAVVAHEVDQYLDSPLDPTDDEDCFDILCWWKINGCKFPILAAIARDILGIQTSTVASESCFSTGGRVIDCFRSSLTPKTVEGLICMQNWLLGDDIAEVVDDCSIENLEFYEEVEKDHESTASSKINVCPAPIPRAKGKGKLGAAGNVIDV